MIKTDTFVARGDEHLGSLFGLFKTRLWSR